MVLLHLQWQHPVWGTYGDGHPKGCVPEHGAMPPAFWRVWGAAGAPPGTCFSAEGLRACRGCHGWWAHVAPCPPLQYFGAAPGRTAIAYGLSQPKTSGSLFLPYKTRMTNTSRPHKGVGRLNVRVCEALTSNSPGSHREAHKQTNPQMWEPSRGEGWACAATVGEGRVQPQRRKEKRPFPGT